VDNSLLIRIVIVIVPTLAGIALYVLLRRRGTAPMASGCAAIALGVGLSFLMTFALLLAA
jgi:hypothetical protein